AGIFKFGKYVMKLAFQSFLHPLIGVYVNWSLLFVVKGADIVHPRDMVLVLVGKNNGIQPLNLFTQHLVSEVRARIDHDHRSLIFKHHRGPQTLVARVRRSANFASAGDYRYALRGSGA